MNYFFDRWATLRLGYAGQTGMLISGLRIAFEIAKTETMENNHAVITVSNLSEKSRNRINANDGMIGILSVGYDEMKSNEIIFMGDIINVMHNLTKPEITTVITLADGSQTIKEKTFSKSYKSGVKISQIVADCITAMGISRKSLPSGYNLTNLILQKGFAFSGYAADCLNKICEIYGLAWSIQNGDVKLYPKNQSDGSQSLASVLIGSPRRIHKKTGGDEEIFDGYEFDCLLLPKAEPGGSVKMVSQGLPNGVHLAVTQAKHSGDTHGDKWTTTILGRLLDAAQ